MHLTSFRLHSRLSTGTAYNMASKLVMILGYSCPTSTQPFRLYFAQEERKTAHGAVAKESRLAETILDRLLLQPRLW
jgi:hypothetical protein